MPARGEHRILPSLGKVTRFGLLTPGRAGQLARRWIGEAGIRPANPRVPAAWLSGGNQQKTLLKMWLETKPKVIIFDEPTRVSWRRASHIKDQVARYACLWRG